MDKHITYKVLPRTVKKIVSLEDNGFLAINPDLATRITASPDGKETVFKWQGGEPIEDIKFGYRFSMNDYSHLCFKVYNEKATNTKLRLRLNLVADNDRYIQGGVCGKVIALDFEGWKEFRILRDHLTVAYPPPFFDSLTVQASGDSMNADIPENTVYFSEITAERETLEVIAPDGISLDDPALYEEILTRYEKCSLGSPEVWDMKQYLEGMNAFAISESDPIAAAKILKEYADKIETFNLVAGFVDGNVINAKQVEELAKTPSKEVLLGRLLGSLQAPLYSLARVLTAVTEKDGEVAAAE